MASKNMFTRKAKLERVIVLWGVLLLVFVCSACQKRQRGAEKNVLPLPEANPFWTYIVETNPYQTWDFWPGYEGMYPGRSPHGAYMKLYANDTAMNAARAGKYMPYGAILVKENYGKDKKNMTALTPMYRVRGYDPDAGDWFWAKYGPDGKVMKAGKVKDCIDCHRVRKANGWLFVRPQ
jgi:hypothetical protein